MAPITQLYTAVVMAVRSLGITTCTPSQPLPKLPFCQVALVNRTFSDEFKNAHQYTYSFQLDMVTSQNKLTDGLEQAYNIVAKLHEVELTGFTVSLQTDPEIDSLVDSSTNQVLNRQMIRCTFNLIEASI